MQKSSFIFVGFILMLGTLVACGTSVRSTTMGAPRTPLPEGCSLEFAQVSATEMMPGAKFGPDGAYETVGLVTVEMPAGTDPFSPEVKAKVRPAACALGGEVLSMPVGPVTNANPFNERHSFALMVWGRRISAAPAKY